MKTGKKRIAVSILTVFMMVFSVIPYMGAKADVAYAASAAEFTISQNVTGISNANNGQVVYTKTFYADKTVGLTMNVEHYSYDYRDYNFKLRLYGPNGAEITPTSGNGYTGATKWASSKFATAGNYTLKLTCGYTGKASGCGYKITGSMVKDKVYTYKFASLSARQSDTGRVFLNIGTYDGPSTNLKDINQAMYRVGAGKIRQVSWNDAHGYTDIEDDGNIEYATAYTYYVVNLDKLSAANKSTLSAVGSSSVTLTSAHQTALADPYVTKSNTVTTKGFVVSGVQNLQVYKKGVRTVSLDWGCTYGEDQYLTGYIMESYNSAGKLMKTKTVNRTGFISGESIYIPYAGTSKVKVTPYEDYTDGKRYYGEPQTISVTSAKIKAPGGHVTKISSTNARIVATRATGATGLQVQQKVGKKWKTVTSGTTVKEHKKTWKKNKAGKTSYRFRSYVKDQGKTYYSDWKTYTPKTNVGTYTKWAVSYIRDLHGAMDVYFYPTKIEYKGSKIKVTGRFINTWYTAPDKGKFKVTFKVDGKSIGYKTITSGTVKGNSAKTTTFYLSGAKKGKDLRSAGYSVKTIY